MTRKLYYRLCFGISCYFKIVYIFILSYASISVGQIRLMHISRHACGGFKIRRIWGFEFIG
jgi:hypothetical protein